MADVAKEGLKRYENLTVRRRGDFEHRGRERPDTFPTHCSVLVSEGVRCQFLREQCIIAFTPCTLT